MDTLTTACKLDSLQRCPARIRSKCPPTAEALAGDVDAQDILVLNLSRAVQLCVDLATHLLVGTNQPPPETMGQAFEQLASARGLDANLARTPCKAAPAAAA